jgi:hypothetical protein
MCAPDLEFFVTSLVSSSFEWSRWLTELVLISLIALLHHLGDLHKDLEQMI